jgi:CheY-like chemotaxis protein
VSHYRPLVGTLVCVGSDRLRAQILVVDDHEPSCELISEILRSAGFEADSLTSSAEAAERLAKEKFHAVFLDMRMPPPDGLELARTVRASRVNASAVIVMITGEQDITLMKRAFDIGVQLFLFKPVERNKLLKLIRVAEDSIEKERRRFMRVPLRRAVSLESNDEQMEGTTVDLSFDGVLVQSYLTFPTGSLVKVKLVLQTGSAALQAEARVVRTIGTDRMGLQFKSLGAGERSRLQEFLLPLILAAT